MNLRDAKIISDYAKYVIKHQRKLLNKQDWNIIGQSLKTTDKLRPFLTRKIVMSNLELANNKILDLLISNDIHPERALNLLKDAETIAKKKENSSDLIKIAKEYIELHDLKPQKVTISESRQQIDYSNMLPEKTKKTISTTKTVNNDNNDNQ